MSLVSVIIICYNGAHYLPDAIESCLTQTYSPLEIIVVDDGSTDNTAEVAQSYTEVKYIYRENGGIAQARNTGIATATGHFIQFLDSDDVILPEKIQRSVAVLQQEPSIGLVYTNYEVRSTDFSNALPSQAPTDRPQGNVVRELVQTTSSFFPPHCPFIRAEHVHATGGFRVGCHGVEDWLMWITLAAQGVMFHYIDEVLAWYREVPGSVSDRVIPMSRARLAAYEFLREVNLPSDIDVEILIAGRHHDLAMKLWRAGEKSEARQHFRHAIKLHPQGRLARILLHTLSYGLTAQQAERLLP